jgi:hypothetical protein
MASLERLAASIPLTLHTIQGRLGFDLNEVSAYVEGKQHSAVVARLPEPLVYQKRYLGLAGLKLYLVIAGTWKARELLLALLKVEKAASGAE